MKTLITSIVLAAATATSAMAFDSNSTAQEIATELEAARNVFAVKQASSLNGIALLDHTVYQDAKTAFKRDFYNIGNFEKIVVQDYGQVSINQLVGVLESALTNSIATTLAPVNTAITLGNTRLAFGADYITQSDVDEAVFESGLEFGRPGTFAEVVAYLNEIHGV